VILASCSSRKAHTIRAAAVNPAYEFTDREFVQDAYRRGLKLIVWIVNNLDDVKKMINIDVDGIISNYPDRVRTILDSGRK
jgi:glycerophosphoryl diester phosphodiesterase